MADLAIVFWRWMETHGTSKNRTGRRDSDSNAFSLQ